ncbi:MAG: LysE type translocator [Pelotomaculum sp. PtaB.Bin104]|nr:MAG: LysE type translocator [Pelotomaculum sp. PtaB.Bin104]
MELLGIFSTAFIVAFSGAMMPGPLLTVAIGESTRRGFVAGPLLILGHGLLEIVLILPLAFGFSSFLARVEVSTAIAVVGGIFLTYMGYTMARDARRGKISLNIELDPAKDIVPEGIKPDQQSRWWEHPVASGILVSLSNPYWSLWWATVGLGYITLSMSSGLVGLSLFFAGHILADLLWYSLVSAAVAGGRKFLTEGLYKGILTGCGVFLIGLGGYFLHFGIFT